MAIYNVVINNDIASGARRWRKVKCAIRVDGDAAKCWVSQRGCGDGERIDGVYISVVGQYHDVIKRNPNIGASHIHVGHGLVVSASDINGERAAARGASAVDYGVVKHFWCASNPLI